MFLFVLLPFTFCLGNQPTNETQSDHPHHLPQQEFVWLPPTKPTYKWPKYTHNPFYRPPWRPPTTYGYHTHIPLASPTPYFPGWIPSKRSPPSFPHYHPKYYIPHQHHHHHMSTEMTPIQYMLDTPFEREDELKPANATEMMELDSQILGSMEKLLTSDNLQTKVEILKSIEMEYDPVLKRFVQKKYESPSQPKHKKRSGEIGLFTHQTHQNLHDVFKKFEKEQMNEALVMRDKKNFQTGRFKFKHDAKIPNKPMNSTKNLLELICNIKARENNNNNIIPSDRFSRNANFYDTDSTRKGQVGNHFYAEPDLNNNSINVYVDDPNFFNFLQGNWSKGGIPIMLTAMSMNKSEDCGPG